MSKLPRSFAPCLIFILGSLAIPTGEAASKSDQQTSAQSGKSHDTPPCSEEFRSRSLPEGVYRVGGRVLPPIPTKEPEATFSDEGRKYAHSVMKTQHIKRFEAKSLVGLTVDANGLPQDICMLNELGHGFDRRAFDSVTKYRFKPATLDGKPVPVRLSIEVTFALW